MLSRERYTDAINGESKYSISIFIFPKALLVPIFKCITYLFLIGGMKNAEQEFM